MKKSFLLSAVILTVSLAGGCTSDGPSGSTARSLEEGFDNPPQEARPRVWWHWLNANISEEGINADLDWMHRVGIGGFHNFDANQDSPRIVEPIVYMTPEWKDVYKKMIDKASSYGMEMAIAASPGWSETGGPWVMPEEAMKKIVWSSTDLEGGKPFSGKLPEPPSVAGAYQDFKSAEGVEIGFYRDIAVLGMRIPEAERSLSSLSPKVTTSGGKADLGILTDGLFDKGVDIAYKNSEAWIQYEFPEPVKIYSLTQSGGGSANNLSSISRASSYAVLESSNDGKVFTKVVDISNSPGVNVAAIGFDPVEAKFFRILFRQQMPNLPIGQLTPELMALAQRFGYSFEPAKSVNISEFDLSTTPRISHFIEKVGFSVGFNLQNIATAPAEASVVIDPDQIVDLTSMMKSDGTLDWTPGEGRWRVLRFGYSLTGKQNSPASPEATGLEVDKFNPDHVRKYIETYLDMYEEATGGRMGSDGVKYIMTDSWEAGCQNWTEEMPRYFKELRGYDLIKYMPAFAGYIVGNSETSDKFLWDWRKTLGELITINHYEVLSEVLKERGMGRYTESHEGNRAYVGDGMEPKKGADIPMAAMWTPTNGTWKDIRYDLQADIRESASVSHIYGQKFVAAESLTSMGIIGGAWGWTPESLKPTADLELANGLNRFVLHSTVHQPTDEKVPGLSLGIFGHWFNRHETWAEQAGPWMDYLARSSYMLQQGLSVADVLYFYGEDTNLTTLFASGKPSVPEGYSWDYVNPDALENVIGVKNGRLTTPAGTTYAVLALDPNSFLMTMKTLRKIEKLLSDGATVIGERPTASPSLVDDETLWNDLAEKIWSDSENGKRYGKGTVYGTLDLEKVLGGMPVEKDLSFEGTEQDAEMYYVHRVVDGVHIYWVDSRNAFAQDVEVSVRLNGLKPEIWDPVTGEKKDASYRMVDGRTIVPVHFEAYDSFFIVLREKTSDKSAQIREPEFAPLAAIDGQWNVSFGKFGAPESTVFGSLSQWKDNKDPSIKYFSGTATYRKTFSLDPAALGNGRRVILDLGKVYNIAEVTLNGKELGTLWRAPFRIDATEALKEGENQLVLKVTSTWVNRLVGDAQPGAVPYTWTSMPFYYPYSPLVESGLEGPVVLYGEK